MHRVGRRRRPREPEARDRAAGASRTSRERAISLRAPARTGAPRYRNRDDVDYLTRAQDAAFQAFRRSLLEDEPDYPAGTVFMWAGEGGRAAIWRHLHDEGRPTVIIRGDQEILFEPVQQSWVHRMVNRLRKRVAVDIRVRTAAKRADFPLIVDRYRPE